MRTITQALRSHKTSFSLIAGVVVLGFALFSCGGGGGYGGGGGMGVLPPGPFSLSTPTDGATGQGTAPALMWTASLYATLYTVQVSTSNTLTPAAASATRTTTSWTVSPALAPGTIYFWQVKASNYYGVLTSPTFSFTT